MIHSRPEIAEEIARIVATREWAMKERQDDRVAGSSTEISARTQTILGKMRDFFGSR